MNEVSPSKLSPNQTDGGLEKEVVERIQEYWFLKMDELEIVVKGNQYICKAITNEIKEVRQNYVTKNYLLGNRV